MAGDASSSREASSNVHVSRLAAIVLRSADADALARFYRDAFDFADEPSDDDERRLVLGDTHLRIERAGPDAAPYPDDVPGWSSLFQHFAIRVSDIDAAMARLVRVDGWRPISTDGPQRLPANTGGVTAFKFRDPDGHPLELLASPDRRDGPLFAGIDHSAISIADVERSIAFYEGLGLVVDGRSLNRGVEQDRLDGIAGATVDVVGLRLASKQAPHVELLCYRGAHERPRSRAEAGDIVATRLVFDSRCAPRGVGPWPWLRDPDGHLLEIVDEGVVALR